MFFKYFIFLCCLIVSSIVSAVLPEPESIDSTVSDLVLEGVIGRRETLSEYRLSDKVLRQEMIAIVTKISGNKLPDSYRCRGYFKDVTSSVPNTWACRTAETAADLGIVTRSRNHFYPEGFVTRSEMLGMLLKAKNLSYSQIRDDIFFPSNTADWQKQVMSTAIDLGYTTSLYAALPNQPATRKEVFEYSHNIFADVYGWKVYTDNSNSQLEIFYLDEFRALIQSRQDYQIILDVRENLETEIGGIPDTLDIPLADVIANMYTSLDRDKEYYVICTSGMRAKEVSEFLRSKGFESRYLEGGTEEWLEAGGHWVGEPSFNKYYSQPQYAKLLSTQEVRQYMNQGDTILIDAREVERYQISPIPGSIHLPIIRSTEARTKKILAELPDKTNVIAICDAYINCFDARLVGITVEREGYTFLGRYNKPYEY